MSQILSQVPGQYLQQQQRLTPQLIQAMDILQLNALALESRITQELDANPALELVSDEDSAEWPAQSPAEEPADGEKALVVEADTARADFERLDDLVREYDWLDDDDAPYRGTKSRARASEEADGKLDAMANTAARPIGLHEYLLDQWQLADVEDDLRPLGVAIIEEIEASGRLNTPLDEIAARLPAAPAPERMEAALRAVQALDPPGIAARSLPECLLLQLDALPGDNSLERRIIAEQFESLQKNRLPAIAKALGVAVDEVKEAVDVIARLSLHPGENVVSRPSPSIVPDVIVEYNEQTDAYDVRLTRSSTRELRISPEFRELLQRSRADKQARQFVKQRIEAASAIIEAVRFRSERLLQVARAVVAAQRDFLDRGEQHLKILRMSELAERFGCDASTISRTVDEKYMQTPRGIYPLRMFFTGGAETDDGEALGWASIRAKVQEIIEQEDKTDPLSDDAIVRRLRTQGVDIKRRTVAKYRAQLNIPPARQRRQY